jgi:hypothetical protein
MWYYQIYHLVYITLLDETKGAILSRVAYRSCWIIVLVLPTHVFEEAIIETSKIHNLFIYHSLPQDWQKLIILPWVLWKNKIIGGLCLKSQELCQWSA